MTTNFAIAAVFLYIVGTLNVLRDYLKRHRPSSDTASKGALVKQVDTQRSLVTATIALFAFIAHAGFGFQLAMKPEGIDFNFFNAGVVISCSIVLVSIAVNSLSAYGGFLVVSFLIAILAILAALIFDHAAHEPKLMKNGLMLHIVLSVIAYSIFTLAGIQAIFIYLQNHCLKRNIGSAFIRMLPPLESMEKLLFDLIYFGVGLLALAILLGFFFVDNFLAQHLSHKAFFSMLSLLIFSVLLFGHVFYGWRGVNASRWTLAGLALLIISYFGSKAVIELILKSG